jgi:uncharacterized protein YndB with AHSA1/START domain
MTADVTGRPVVQSRTEVAIKPREVSLTRVINAPRDLVYRAFTDADMLAKWFGPHGFENHVTSDPCVGGTIRIEMIAPDGVKYPIFGRYQEVVPNEKIVFTSDFSEYSDAWKTMMRENLSGPATEDELLNSIADITFEDAASNATRVTVRSLFASDAVRDSFLSTGMNDGWEDSFKSLDAYLTEL